MLKRFTLTLLAATALLHAQAPQPATGLSVSAPLAPLSCPSPATGQATTYYMAINEPGADNAACDGLAPNWVSAGHCPFKDFSTHNTFVLLTDTSGVRLEVRAGRYHFVSEGLSIQGVGTSEATRTVLTAYQNETVWFDGDYLRNPVLRVAGQYSTVERINVEHGAGYNLRVGGTGTNNVVQCNRLGQNGTSDSLKVVEGASPLITRNEFYGWDSQAIDMAPGVGAVVTYNDFHDSLGVHAGAFGAKFESHDVTFSHNRVRNSWGVNPGGTSSVHAANYEAQRIVVSDNTFENTPGPVAKLYSCLDCSVLRNTGSTVGGGFVLGGFALDGSSGCSNGTAECVPTANATVTGNRLRMMNGAPPRTPWVVYTTESVGLTASNNIYCTAAATVPQFYIDAILKTFAQWTAALATDSSSIVGTEGAGYCAW